MDKVTYKGIDYPIKTIVIFGQTEYDFSVESLGNQFDFDAEEADETALKIDEMIAGYVPDDLFANGTDEEIAAWIEENLYGNEPTEPNTKMPFDWFDAYVDCVDETDDDNADELYFKQAKDGIRVYDMYREYVATINFY